MARKTREEALKTRAMLLDAALAVFLRKGYFRTSLTDIAEEVGMTRGAVYGHFRNKVDLYTSLLDDVFQPIEDFFNALMREESSGNGLRAVMENWFENLAENERLLQALELDLHRTERCEELQPRDEEIKERFKGYMASVENHFRKGQELGWVKPELDPGAAATYFMAVLIGMGHYRLDQPDRHDWRASVPLFVDMFFHGVAR
ncbi:TetR family transcriptional regulator [Pseudodesulfovibrio tunisiensis]|uniref:TetR family transcriptional regulator n=1 Tax=Pseudodesulfovibrio tunisiensis TaxID=463192 RepID=UPI001FB30231|nr:TetR family transcriptional regulator [Pseudodesulfovibrio tunisiensis]